MTSKKITKITLKLNKNNYFKSFAIVIVSLFTVVLLTLIVASVDMVPLTVFNYDEQNYSRFVLILKTVVMSALSIFATIILSSISMGETAIYNGRVLNKKRTYKRFIYWIMPSKAFKAFRLKVTLFGLNIIWLFVLIIPSIVILASIIYLAFSGGIELYLFFSLSVSSLLFLIVGIVFAFIISQRYFLAPYLLAENPEFKVLQVIKQSKNLMDYQIFRVVKFKISFIPLFLLSFLIFPLIFIYPHYKQSSGVIAKMLTV